MQRTALRREIIATVVANSWSTAPAPLRIPDAEETGAPPADLARAYAVAREVFEHALVLGAQSRGSTTRLSRPTQLAVSIEGRPGGALDPLAGAGQPER